MAGEDFTHLKQMLLSRREAIFDRSLGLESGWRSLEDRDSELEEEAQKITLMSLYDELALRDQREIEEIDRALLKIEQGSFGCCERCKKPISRARLEALPEVRLCLSCARKSEKALGRRNDNREAMSCSAAPSGYEDLSDEDLAELIKEALRNDGRIDTQDLDVTIHGGTIRLNGVLPSEEEHQIILRILLDSICFGSLVDRLEISEVTSERKDLMPERFVLEPRMGIPLEMGEEETTDDPFEMQEEDIAFDVPDRPPAEQFPSRRL
jgi:RNA polymerase-binding transcription factor DksA